MIRGYDRGLQWVLRHQLLDAVSHARADRADRLSLRRSSPRASSPSRTPASSSARPKRARTPRSPRCPSSSSELADDHRDGSRPSPASSALPARPAATRPRTPARLFIQLKPLGERDVSAQEVIQRLRPKVAQVIGREVLHAGRSGRQRRRPAQQDRVPIHAHRHRHGRAQSLGADPAAAMEKLPELQDVASRPADRLAAHRHRHRPRRRLSARPLARRRSTRRSTTRSASARSRRSTRRAISTRSSSKCDRSSRTTRRRCRASIVDRRPAARVPLSTIAKFSNKIEPLTVNHQGQFPPSRCRSTSRPASRSARRSSASSSPGATCMTPITLQGTFQGTAQAFQHRCHRRRCWSPPRSWSSTSCSASSTRATSTRSPSCRPCRRPASAR